MIIVIMIKIHFKLNLLFPKKDRWMIFDIGYSTGSRSDVLNL